MYVFVALENKGLTDNQLDGVIPIRSPLIRAKTWSEEIVLL